MNRDKSYIDIQESMNSFRNVGKLLREFSDPENKYGETKVDSENDTDAIPYTMQDEIMANITQTAKTQFGADFSQSDKPMLYYPKDGDVTLSGTISDMNDAKFQFRYKDSSGNGCYLFVSPLQLTDETLKKLSVINGVFKNWKKDLSSAEDIKPMSLKNEV